MKPFHLFHPFLKIVFLIFFSYLMATSLSAQENGFSGGKTQQQALSNQKRMEVLANALRENITENILPFWTSKMIDTINGGFYGRIDGNNLLHPDAVKGGILNARILWTFSSAFRVLKDSAYLKTATRARDYILEHFIDKQFGGAYMSLKANGEPADIRKQVYTQAFFIYSLSEYYLASGDEESLTTAKSIYSLLEKNCLDVQYNGYFEVFSREWQRTHDRIIGEKSKHDEKGMNTHLHLMEAYANLYRAWPDPGLKQSLKNLIEIFYDKIIDKQSFHLICFSDKKWQSTSPIESYGHDIETSWLLVEAADLLNDSELTDRIEKLSLKMARAAEAGIQSDGSMVYERNKVKDLVDKNRDWWTQAETVVGFVNAYQLSGEVSYLDKAENTWKYISGNFVDTKEGEWFNSISESGARSKGDKAGYWKCPYHNSRMCLEIIRRAK